MNGTEFLNVALSLPTGDTFQYLVPESLKSRTEIGKRVWVSVRNRRLVGYAVGFSDKALFDGLKPIDSVIDEGPVLSDNFLALTRWIADYYFCSWGQAIEAAMPAPFKKGKFLMKSRSPRLIDRMDSVRTEKLELTEHQRSALDKISPALDRRDGSRFLLHGITGSGKTEIYLQLIDKLIRQKRGSIVLVPEISLTPQTVERFHARFGPCLAVIHSRLSQAHRVEEWHRIQRGEALVVIGARSAVFSPVRDLGLIVIDEEQETSYKQGEAPRYETRRVAEKRCELEGSVLVMGSATPSLEAFFDTTVPGGKTTLVELPERIEKRPLPVVSICDMRREAGPKGEKIFSVALEAQVKDALAKKEQVMLLLNRRGFSTYLHCASCGYVASCKNCRTSLAYHFDKSTLLCHVCGARAETERLCPSCQKHYLHYFGTGTQKVEEAAARQFPGARVARMDSDSTTRKDAHEKILTAFKNHEIDILIGTQMIAKGHDFPRVSLIGVISADTALHIPDFRAAERTFDLLTQVAGRAGRGDIPGKVVVQTFVPHHYSIKSAQDHNYAEFYEREVGYRKELYLPPYSHLASLVFAGPDEKDLLRQLLGFKKILESKLDKQSMAILGPAPCLISKERGMFRWNLIVKAPTIEVLAPRLREALKEFKKMRITVTVDIDPQ